MSEITFYCPNCWREIPPHASVCAFCQTHLDERANDSFVEKLLAALNHPVPAKAAFAAYLLGELRERNALEALLEIARERGEPERREAAIIALGKLGDARAMEALTKIAADEASYARERVAAENALRALRSASLTLK